MDFMVYFAGGQESDEALAIMDKWGVKDDDPVTNFPIWKVSILSIADLLELTKELGLISFKTYLPNINGDEPIIELIIAKEKNLC